MKLFPSEIRYSQDSILNRFMSGRQIGETLDDICEKRCNIDDIPIISVASLSGKWRTADNRRLWVFKQLEILGKCDKIPVRPISSIPSKKQTSNNNGQSVIIRRGDPGGHWYKIAKRTPFKKPTSECRSENVSMSHASEGNSQTSTQGGILQLHAPRNVLQQSLTSKAQSKSLSPGILPQPNACKYQVQNHAPRGPPQSEWTASLSRLLAERNLQRQASLKAQSGMSLSFTRVRPSHPYTPKGLHKTLLLRSLLETHSLRHLTELVVPPGILPKTTSLYYMQQRLARGGTARSYVRRTLSYYGIGLSVPDVKSGLSHAYVPSLTLNKMRPEVTVYSDSDESLNHTYESDRDDDTDQAYENDSNDSISQTYGSDPGSDDSTTYETDTGSEDSTTYETDTSSDYYTTYESDTGSVDLTTYKSDTGSVDLTTYKSDTGSVDLTTYKSDTGSVDSTTYESDTGSDDSINQSYESESDDSSNQTYESDGQDSLHHLFECDCDTMTRKTFESDDELMIQTYKSEDEDSTDNTYESDDGE